jgi:predicted DCC family thiol-disulfide oxidoreductase YuxK
MENPYNWPEIVFFDGVCVLCNRSVDFLLKRDRRKKLRFASLQSETAGQFLAQNNYPHFLADTIVLYSRGRFFTKSEAVLKIAGLIGFPYSIAFVLKIFPITWRDKAYDFVARNRLKWFGVFEKCRIPDEETRNRIIG